MTRWQAYRMVVVVVLVLVPLGASAKKPRPPKPVTINDVTTGTAAAVDDNGNLKVTGTIGVTGSIATTLADPTSGTGAGVDADGNLKVVTTLAAPPRPVTTINTIALSVGNTRDVLFQGVGENRLSITSLTFAATGPNPGSVPVFVSVYVSDSSAGDCEALTGATFGAAERFTVVVPIGDTVNVTYPSPLVYSAYAADGRRWCVDVSPGTGPTGYTAYVSASGFLNY